MARAANQKLKCLYLWQFLLQNTDEEHPATIPQMIEYLARHDIPAERKSLYDDIEALRQCGLDVEYRKAQGGGYYVASREFQLPELKLLELPAGHIVAAALGLAVLHIQAALTQGFDVIVETLRARRGYRAGPRYSIIWGMVAGCSSSVFCSRNCHRYRRLSF